MQLFSARKNILYLTLVKWNYSELLSYASTFSWAQESLLLRLFFSPLTDLLPPLCPKGLLIIHHTMSGLQTLEAVGV